VPHGQVALDDHGVVLHDVLLGAQVPLAEVADVVARVIQPLEHRGVFEAEPLDLRVGRIERVGGVVVVAGALVVQAQERAGPARAAHRRGVRGPEPSAVAGD
jgi:hypothetical protein